MLPDSIQPKGWPADGLEAAPSCPLCCCEKRTLLYEGLRDHVFHSAPGAWTMFCCAGCGSAYLDPRPNRATVGLAYGNYYTHRRRGDRTGILRDVMESLSNDYFRKNIGLHSKLAIWPGRHLLQLLPITRIGLDTLIARNLDAPAATGASLLDVGCGNGGFLAFARDAGWQVKGVDFDPRAVEAARALGLDVSEGGIELLAAESEVYDRITLSHVIEHVHEPWALLQHCFRLLKKNGTLWLETPNIDSVGHRFFASAWRGLEPPRHLQVFSRACLVEKLQETGFVEIDDKFNSRVTKGLWISSNKLLSPEKLQHRWRHTFLGQIYAEFLSLRNPIHRELITLLCSKPA